jgi:hypothetical protein
MVRHVGGVPERGYRRCPSSVRSRTSRLRVLPSNSCGRRRLIGCGQHRRRAGLWLALRRRSGRSPALPRRRSGSWGSASRRWRGARHNRPGRRDRPLACASRRRGGLDRHSRTPPSQCAPVTVPSGSHTTTIADPSRRPAGALAASATRRSSCTPPRSATRLRHRPCTHLGPSDGSTPCDSRRETSPVEARRLPPAARTGHRRGWSTRAYGARRDARRGGSGDRTDTRGWRTARSQRPPDRPRRAGRTASGDWSRSSTDPESASRAVGPARWRSSSRCRRTSSVGAFGRTVWDC